MERLGENFIDLLSDSRSLGEYGLLLEGKDRGIFPKDPNLGDHLLRSRPFQDLFNREDHSNRYSYFGARSLLF